MSGPCNFSPSKHQYYAILNVTEMNRIYLLSIKQYMSRLSDISEKVAFKLFIICMVDYFLQWFQLQAFINFKLVPHNSLKLQTYPVYLWLLFCYSHWSVNVDNYFHRTFIPSLFRSLEFPLNRKICASCVVKCLFSTSDTNNTVTAVSHNLHLTTALDDTLYFADK